MKILTKKNGIALVAVLTVLLVLTLLLPAMFTMSENATYWSVVGKDIQRASYLARSICEMSIGTFKTTYSRESNDSASATSKIQAEYDKLQQKKISEIKTNIVKMYVNQDDGEDYRYSTDLHKTTFQPLSLEGYDYIGEGSCTITYSNSIEYFLQDLTNNKTYQIEDNTSMTAKTIYKTLYDTAAVKGDILQNHKDLVLEITGESENNLKNHTFTVTSLQNEAFLFTSTATVNGKKATRSAIVVLPTNPAEKNWLVYQSKKENGTYKKEGTGNETFVNLDMATGMSVIEYSDGGINADDYKPQTLLTFSCLGNMHITTKGLKDLDGNLVENVSAYDGTDYVLDCAPGLNTTPANDPTYRIIDGINAAQYHPGEATADVQDDIQRGNFIAFTATNSITVDLPVQLLVNPCRASRIGDMTLDYLFDWELEWYNRLQLTHKNQSIYKNLVFQAPDIVFNRGVDMLVSFYTPNNNRDARRITSVTLSAPENSTYSYKKDNGEVVRAGRVLFMEDCYVYVVNYGDDGSGYSDSWYEFPRTVYYRDSDFTKIKVASAGDMYYFNTEVALKSKTTNKDTPIGFSLAAYAIETKYYNDYINSAGQTSSWWEIWTKMQQAIFSQYLYFGNEPVYEPDDFRLIGNMFEDGFASGDITSVDPDELYVLWLD